MTIAEQIREKATKATEQRERRRIGLNLQAEGFPISKIAQLLVLPEDEVEELLRPIAS